jgi:hypothetical protein
MVNVYFDSPLVMDLIGLGGKVRQAHAKRLLEGFQQLNFVPLIGPDMVFELSNNLKGLLYKNARDRYGPTATALRKGEFKIDFVEAVRDHLEVRIQAAGIEIDRNFTRHIEHSPINQSAEMVFLSAIQSHYTHLEAAERDVRAIRGVYGRRGSAQPQDIFSSKAIFLTSNELLAALANRYFRDREGYGKGTFPVVVTRSVAAALGDAILGIATSGNMSLTDMLVSAANATQYNGQIFAKIETHLREISPEQADDLLEVLERPDFSQLAMDLVRGSPRNVTVQSIERLTTVIKSRLQAEAELLVSTEVNRERAQAALDIEAHRSLISTQNDRLNAALEHLREKHLVDTARMRGACERALATRARLASAWFLMGAVVATVVGVAAYAATCYSGAMEQRPGWRLLLAIVTAVASAAPLYGLPSLKERALQWLVKRQDDGIAKEMLTLGYPSTVRPTATTAVDCMDQLFSEKLAVLTAPRPEMSKASKSSLFD